MFRRYFHASIALLVLFPCCRSQAPATQGGPQRSQVLSVTGPPCIIYRTRNDYSHQVAVSLSADRSAIVSYPDVRDIRNQGDGVYPTPLIKGYFLDNRGIGTDVAFLQMTYQEYALLEKTPAPKELMKKILDSDPLIEMYSCGSRSSMEDPVAELNARIGKSDFRGLTRLK